LERKEIVREYNFGPDDGNCVTSGTLAGIFCEIWGQGVCWKVQENQNTLREAKFLELDSSKAKVLLGWEPVLDIRSSVEKVIEFEKCLTDREKLFCFRQQIKVYFN
jgi:CDP-glucose 4,6-dehydratase